MEDQTNIAIVLALACFVSAFLIVIIILMKARDNASFFKLQGEMKEELMKATLNAEEKERDRIFHNMHDQVSPMIRRAMRNLYSHQMNAKQNVLVREEEYEEDIHLLFTALNEIKSCTHDMIPLFLLEFGLIKALESEFRTQTREIQATYINKFKLGEELFQDGNRLLNSYRMTLAIIDNVFRHSHCKKCQLMITNENKTLCLEIRHDGEGISNEEAEKYARTSVGTGLKSSRVRAMMLDATIDFRKGVGNSSVKISIPVL